MNAEHAIAEESRSPAVPVAEREDDVDALWEMCIDHIIAAAGYADRLAVRYDGQGPAGDLRSLADQLHQLAWDYGKGANA